MGLHMRLVERPDQPGNSLKSGSRIYPVFGIFRMNDQRHSLFLIVNLRHDGVGLCRYNAKGMQDLPG